MDALAQHEILSIVTKTITLCDDISRQPQADTTSLNFVKAKLASASEKLHLIPLLPDDMLAFMDELAPAMPVLGLMADRTQIRGTALEASVNALLAYIEGVTTLASAMVLQCGDPEDSAGEAALPPEVLDSLQAEGVDPSAIKVVHLGQMDASSLNSLLALLKKMSEGDS